MRDLGIGLLFFAVALCLLAGRMILRALARQVAFLEGRVSVLGRQVAEQRCLEHLRSRRLALWDEHIGTGSELAFKRLETIDSEVREAQKRFGERA